MKEIMIQNEFGIWVHDIFAEWLSIHALGDIDNPNPIHNNIPLDIFNLALIGIYDQL